MAGPAPRSGRAIRMVRPGVPLCVAAVCLYLCMHDTDAYLQRPAHVAPLPRMVRRRALELSAVRAPPAVLAHHAGLMFASGAILGPLLDGIHSRVHLIEYHTGSVLVPFLNLETSIYVPVLLGLFYASVGLLAALSFDAASIANYTWGHSLLSLGVLAAFLQLPSYLVFVLLSALSACVYIQCGARGRDAAISAAAALLSVFVFEPALCVLFQLWTYPRHDLSVLGYATMSWVVTCYFSYVSVVLQFARTLLLQLIRTPKAL